MPSKQSKLTHHFKERVPTLAEAHRALGGPSSSSGSGGRGARLLGRPDAGPVHFDRNDMDALGDHYVDDEDDDEAGGKRWGLSLHKESLTPPPPSPSPSVLSVHSTSSSSTSALPTQRHRLTRGTATQPSDDEDEDDDEIMSIDPPPPRKSQARQAFERAPSETHDDEISMVVGLDEKRSADEEEEEEEEDDLQRTSKGKGKGKASSLISSGKKKVIQPSPSPPPPARTTRSSVKKPVPRIRKKKEDSVLSPSDQSGEDETFEAPSPPPTISSSKRRRIAPSPSPPPPTRDGYASSDSGSSLPLPEDAVASTLRASSSRHAAAVSSSSRRSKPVATPARSSGKSQSRSRPDPPSSRKRPTQVIDSDDDDEEDEDEEDAPRVASARKKRALSKGKGKERAHRDPDEEDLDMEEEDLEDDAGRLLTVDSRMRSSTARMGTAAQRRKELLSKLQRKRAGHSSPVEIASSEEEDDEDEGPAVDGYAGAYTVVDDDDVDEDDGQGGGEDEEDAFIVNDGDGIALDELMPEQFQAVQPMERNFAVLVQWHIFSLIRGRSWLRAEGKTGYFDSAMQRIRNKVLDVRSGKITSQIWPAHFKKALERYPVWEGDRIDEDLPPCDACRMSNRPATRVLQLCGKPYDKRTFETLRADTDDEDDEEGEVDRQFNCGKYCFRRAQVHHQMSHWEYHLRDEIKDKLATFPDPNIEVVDALGRAFARPDALELPNADDADAVHKYLEDSGFIAMRWRETCDMIDSGETLDAEFRRGERDDDQSWM